MADMSKREEFEEYMENKEVDDWIKRTHRTIDTSKEYILCAAIWYKEFEKPHHSPINVDRGVVLCGHRHGHIIGQILSLTGKRHPLQGEKEQGFLTSKNRFLDRKEALKLFIENGGQPEMSNLLFSEDLYTGL